LLKKLIFLLFWLVILPRTELSLDQNTRTHGGYRFTFEGDRNHVYRILRSLKKGLDLQLKLVSTKCLEADCVKYLTFRNINFTQDEELSEQRLHPHWRYAYNARNSSLVSTAVYGTPQRSTTGYNAKRLNMILAVLKELVLGLAPRRILEHYRRNIRWWSSDWSRSCSRYVIIKRRYSCRFFALLAK
jgi:hypothetical protein